MPKLIVIAAVVLVAVACGATGTGTGVQPTPSAGSGFFDVTATEKDHAVSMHVGQSLEVVLHGGGHITYQQVKTSEPSILEPTVDPAATAARGVTLAAFRAKASGLAQVSAIGVPVCPSGQACPMYAMLYSLTVTITP